MKSFFPQSMAEVPAQFQLPAFLEQREYLINGEIRQWAGEFQDVISPVCLPDAEGKMQRVAVGKIPLLTAKEALEALDAANVAYSQGRGLWATMTVNERIVCMDNFLTQMRTKRTEVVNLLMWEIGKTLKDAEKEFDRTVEYMYDTIEALKNIDRNASNFEMAQGIIAQVRRVPLGVALCMGPYNYPLNETFSTLLPALLMGNTVVFKPAKYGVLLVRPLLEAFRDCFPKGVINVIYGLGRTLCGAIMETGKVNVFAFIGTNKGANDLKKMHPKPHTLKSILGLDAKNPAIILPDADIPATVKECVLGSLSFNGQRCTALKIILVHESIADEFNRQFVEAVGKLKAGMPWEDGVSLTPLPERGKCADMQALVDDATAHGAKIMNERGESNETFFSPAVLYPANEKMRLYREEQFGPIVPIMPFKETQEAIEYVVNSSFGQQASIFGKNPQEIGNVVDALCNQVSRININAQCQRGPDIFPFNGRKDSAEGTLSVYDALRAFSIRAMVATKYEEGNKTIVREILKNGYSSFLHTDYIL
ncbi:MAG: NADP-dependent glyceraldehyde-3-phosphate dehydrogenase [Bacteroidetes bacterium]|nr:MAG: NADP-dependent glyceraldehyde-3-phosphate dehydrogenase [Bacteroidota bacterium]